MAHQIPLRAASIVGEDGPHDTVRVAADITMRRLTIVNVAFVGTREDRRWVLVDAGPPGARDAIVDAAASLFGHGVAPEAIVLTHGHFDHVGAAAELAAHWDVPVWAHAAEMPYLDGSASYPPPDPGVGGLVALASPLFPRAPVSLGQRLRTLPDGGDLPPLPGWSWIHTPGHSVGHVSLFRASDRALIAGDAFVTTAQEYAFDVATQASEMHGPPRYFTHDWEAAARSVRLLAHLRPALAVTGHGRAVGGPLFLAALDQLAAHFEQVAVPVGGRYVGDPQRAEDASAYRSS